MHLKQSFLDTLTKEQQQTLVSLYTVNQPTDLHQAHLQAQIKIPFTNTIATIDLINADQIYQIGLNLGQFNRLNQSGYNLDQLQRYLDYFTDHRWKFSQQGPNSQWVMVNRQYDPDNFKIDVQLAYQLAIALYGSAYLMLKEF